MRGVEIRQATGVRRRRAWALGGIAAAALVVAGGTARAGDRPHVTYLGSDVAGGAAGVETAACDAAVVKGLQRTAIELAAIDASKVPRTAEGLICAGPACLAQAAGATGAVYFVRAEAAATAQAIEGKVQVFRAQPFQAVSSADFACDNCSAETLAQRFEQRATDAMVKALANRTPEGTAGDLAASVPEQEGRPAPPRVGPWVAIGVGAALAITGVVLIARGDQSTCPGVAASDCGRTYSDARTGWLLGGVGAAAVLGGVAWGWLLGDARGGKAGGTTGGVPAVSLVGVGPGGVTVGGRF